MDDQKNPETTQGGDADQNDSGAQATERIEHTETDAAERTEPVNPGASNPGAGETH